MGIINLDGSHFVDQEIEGGREPPPSLAGEPTAMHEVNPLQCNNSYSGDCGRAGRTGGLTPIPGQALKREGEPRDQFRRAHSGTHSAGSWGPRFPFPSPGKANCPRCPKAQPPPLPPIPTPARPWRARVSAVTSPHPAPKCEPAAAGPARGKAAPGAGTGVVPSPAAPRSLGERSPLGRQRPSLALPGREGGEGRGRGSLQAAPPSERASAARAPVAGEKSAPGPAPSPRAQRPLLVRPRSYAETPPGPRQRAAAEGR